ncbi:MAG: PAS domain S-box-containing protein [Paracoccaceae bacterium]|jgi:PAS domain S-box-containing protein
MSHWTPRRKIFIFGSLLCYLALSATLLLTYIKTDKERHQSAATTEIFDAVSLVFSDTISQDSASKLQALRSILAASGLDRQLSCLTVSMENGTKLVWPIAECDTLAGSPLERINMRVRSSAVSVQFAFSPTNLSEQISRDVLWLIGATLLPVFVLVLPFVFFYRRVVSWPILDNAKELAEAHELEDTLSTRLEEKEKMEADLRAVIVRAEAGERLTKKAQSQLHDAIEAVPDGFVLYDDDDKLVWCNQKYREIYDASAEFIKPGVLFEEIIREGVKRGQYVDAIGCEEEWIAERLRQHRSPTGETEQKLPNGHWVRVGERVTADGCTAGFRADVTELKNREEALRQSEEQLRQTIDAALDCIIVIDSDGEVIEFNPGAEETFGYKRADVIGQQMDTLLMPPKYRHAHNTGLSKYLETGEGSVLGKRLEIEGMRADGTYFPAELAINVAPRGDSKIFIGYLRDITDQKTAEGALRLEKERAEIANSAKDQFLAMMSHEIRTPLNGVIGLLGLLEDTQLDGGQEEYVRIARQSGEGLLDLINDILDYSKMEADKLELENAVFELRPLIDSVIDVLSPAALEKAISISAELDDDLPPLLIGDQGRIRQILLNLASNAVKFTSEGAVQIRTGAGSTGNDGMIELRFEINDTGIGIPAEKHQSLFREFTTVDPSYSRKFGGTGLGLAISRRLTEMMDGEIGVQSVEGKGSTFWFHVPVAVAEGDPNAYEDLPEILPASPTARKAQRLSILVADDTPTNGLVARKMLETLGHSVDTVLNGVEAIEAITARRYDLVFMDISMPEMDGLAATAAIRGMDIPSSGVPIIALTAYAMKGDRERFIQAGMDDYLSKPIVRAQMLRILDEWSDRRHSHSLSSTQNIRPEDATTGPGIDRNTLETLAAQIDHDDLVAVIGSFIDDAGKRLSQLEEARVAGNIEALEAAAHAMRSMTATFGVTSLSATFGIIEDLCIGGDPEQALKLAENLAPKIDEAFAALKQFVDECAG